MAYIRQVLQNQDTEKWGYIEHSDENENHLILLGNKEFETESEAIEWSKGFATGSYDYVKPRE